jgi:hypothetical protein
MIARTRGTGRMTPRTAFMRAANSGRRKARRRPERRVDWIGRRDIGIERALKRLKALAATRQRAEEFVETGKPSPDALLKLLRATIQQGLYLRSLPDDLYVVVPDEVLDRYDAAFRALTGRSFDARTDGITWDEVAA